MASQIGPKKEPLVCTRNVLFSEPMKQAKFKPAIYLNFVLSFRPSLKVFSCSFCTHRECDGCSNDLGFWQAQPKGQREQQRSTIISRHQCFCSMKVEEAKFYLQ